MPDFVVGLHIATGSGRTLWIEKASKPVLNEEFATKIGAKLIRDDEIFNAAVVSFGTFGIIAAVAVETATRSTSSHFRRSATSTTTP